MNPLKILLEILRNSNDLGYGTLLGAVLFGIIYLAVGAAIPSFYSLEYLIGVLSVGGLLGSAVEKRLASIDRDKNRLNEARINRQIAQEDINFIQHNKELGYLTDSQVLKSTDQVLNNLLLSNQENETTNLLESQEQKQISSSQEEE